MERRLQPVKTSVFPVRRFFSDFMRQKVLNTHIPPRLPGTIGPSTGTAPAAFAGTPSELCRMRHLCEDTRFVSLFSPARRSFSKLYAKKVLNTHFPPVVRKIHRKPLRERLSESRATGFVVPNGVESESRRGVFARVREGKCTARPLVSILLQVITRNEPAKVLNTHFPRILSKTSDHLDAVSMVCSLRQCFSCVIPQKVLNTHFPPVRPRRSVGNAAGMELQPVEVCAPAFRILRFSCAALLISRSYTKGSQYPLSSRDSPKSRKSAAGSVFPRRIGPGGRSER